MPPVLAGLIGAVTMLALVLLVVAVRRGLALRRQLSGPRPGSVTPPDLGAAIDFSASGAMIVGSHDEVLKVNELGQAMSLARGSRVGFKELLELVRRVRNSGEPFVGRLQREREPGREATELSGRVFPVSDGIIMVLAEDESASRRVDAVRRDFVANVSHELKTPIGAIAILAEAIEAASDDQTEVTRFVERLQRETARLAELVNQIIDLSRLQSSDPLLSRTVVEVDEIVDEALARSRESAAKRSVSVIRAKSVPSRVVGDRWQLADAVTNLVQNAISYSGEKARVVVTAAPVSEDGEDFVDIKVADNGIGIPLEEQERIFERFYRVDYGRSRDSGGTGLGLSIVRHIAGAHGGEVKVWSRPHQGSTFTLRLPAFLGEALPDEPDDESEGD